MQEEWSSPDDKIFKRLLLPGELGRKPYEGSTIKLNIIDCSELFIPFNGRSVVVGDNDGELGRMIDICVCTMNLKERALFTITLGLEQVTATIELVELEFNGFIYEWDAQKKYDMALKHKEKGAQFFAKKNQFEAAHWFTKALKILSSIPIDVECPPSNINGVSLNNINKLKEKLYNNLASCYFREHAYDMVIQLCQKVLAFDGNNVKALYKIGVAYESDKNYERARTALSKALEIEPQNKACAEHLSNVNVNLKKANMRVNDMMKKMMAESLGK